MLFTELRKEILQMKKLTIITRKPLLTILFWLWGLSSPVLAQQLPPHKMQHGFILSAGDKFASHLVATGHHSRQTEVIGQLSIMDPRENKIYINHKLRNVKGDTYFLFQAQDLDLPSLRVGQVLSGHIIESKVGKYEPNNIIVKKAFYKIEQILLNMENPFFSNKQ